jgi:hypothetical protein
MATVEKCRDSGSLGIIHTEFSSHEEKTSDRWIRYYLQSAARELLPDHRVRICMRHRLPFRDTVDVCFNPDRKRAHYSGVMRCDDGWVCPICAGIKSEKRRVGLQKALNDSRYTYLRFMITYTLRHNLDQTLEHNINTLTDAYTRFKSGRAWQDIKKRFAWVGSIRGTEITWGPLYGWHPHYHELAFLEISQLKNIDAEYFIENTPDLEFIEGVLDETLQERWLAALGSAGGNGVKKIALDVTATNEYIAEYVSKMGHMPELGKGWNQSHEITRGGDKIAKGQNRTAFALLVAYTEGDKQAGRLFQEYAETMKGRSTFQWSRGIKNLLNIEGELGDLISPYEDTEGDMILARLSIDVWHAVIRHKKQAKLLDIADSGNLQSVLDFLQTIPGIDLEQCGIDDIST